MSAHPTRTAQIHAIGKCAKCKAPLRATVTQEMRYNWNARRYVSRFSSPGFDRQYSPMGKCACGSTVYMKPIAGFETDCPCDKRCTSAKGHNCECSCGGANHGADWDAPAVSPAPTAITSETAYGRTTPLSFSILCF